MSSQLSIDGYYMEQLKEMQMNENDLLILDMCKEHNYTRRCSVITEKIFSYPEILMKSTFCLIFRGERMGQFVLLEAMAANCIPVIIMDGVTMPFNEVLDWKRAAIFIMEDFLHTLKHVINQISGDKIMEMRRQIQFLYKKYFKDLNSIVETTLDIIQDRVYPHWGRTYDDWNVAPENVCQSRTLTV